MSKRIRCCFHAESTPSLVIYSRAYKCYGCSKHGPLSELPEDLRPLEGEIEDEEPENIEETFRYIHSLRRTEQRGIECPTDKRGYYIVWPNDAYYKLRLFDGKPKYIGARGIKPPLFWARRRIK